MTENTDKTNGGMGQITSDDQLWAALAWIPITPLWPIIAVLLLLMEEKRNRPFIRYNAILSLITGVVGIILAPVCIGIILLLAMFYFAYQAYMGQTVEIPVLTDFCKKQGWL